MFWSETIRDAGEGGHHPSALFSGGKGSISISGKYLRCFENNHEMFTV
jgi:hypothetical protein